MPSVRSLAIQGAFQVESNLLAFSSEIKMYHSVEQNPGSGTAATVERRSSVLFAD